MMLVVGDKGQRYEVTFKALADGVRKVFGWAYTPEGADALKNSIKLNPSMSDPQVRDREKNPDLPPPALARVTDVSKKRSYES